MDSEIWSPASKKDTEESGGYRFAFTKKIENVTGDAEMITLGRERENREREDLARVEESFEEGAQERGVRMEHLVVEKRTLAEKPKPEPTYRDPTESQTEEEENEGEKGVRVIDKSRGIVEGLLERVFKQEEEKTERQENAMKKETEL